jgi:2-dehydropantoate 2-reductase
LAGGHAAEAVDRGPILIWGAGAIGGTVGAHLVRAGHAVVFVDIAEDHVAAIRDPARGLQIEGPVAAFGIHAPAYLPAELKGVFRHVFLCVKTHDTEAACRQLLPHLAPDGCVLSLQNGLCEKTIAEVCGAGRTMGAFVNFGADWLGPGRITFGNRGAVVVGEIDGITSPHVNALHALRGGGARFPGRGRAHAGLQLLAFNGFDPAAFAPGAEEAAARALVAAMVEFNRPNAKTHSGIWRDP